MTSIEHLEFFHDGAWHRIGWDAWTWESKQDLRAHGSRLAAQGGHYRITTPSHLADAPDVVLHEYPGADA